MQNLAGHPDCDPIIRRELTRCGIKLVECVRTTDEVPYSITGVLEDGQGRAYFTFNRAWYYWRVAGRVPLAIAEALYADPVCRADVRVTGHAGGLMPKLGARWYTSDGRQILKVKEKVQCESYVAESQGIPDSTIAPIAQKILDENIFSDNPEGLGFGCVESYHIDSELGLYIFARTMRFWIDGGAPMDLQSWEGRAIV